MDFRALTGMTLAEMEAEFRELAETMSVCSVRRQRLLERISRLRADVLVKANVNRLSAEEKSALRSALNEETP